jgi:transposase-like protein
MTEPVYGKDYLDNPPIRAVTAEEVRTYLDVGQCKSHPRCSVCDSQILRKFGPRLLEHPGVSSTARAVIEAMLGVDRG